MRFGLSNEKKSNGNREIERLPKVSMASAEW